MTTKKKIILAVVLIITIGSARAEITRSEAEQRRAKIVYARTESMSKDGLISRAELDRAKADVDISAASVNAAKARLAQTEAQYAQVLKQKDGVVLRINQ